MDIKFASIKAVSFTLKPAPLGELLEAIRKRLGPGPGVYSAEPAVLNLLNWSEEDWRAHGLALADLLAPFKVAGVNVVEVQSKLPALEDEAEQLGLRHGSGSGAEPNLERELKPLTDKPTETPSADTAIAQHDVEPHPPGNAAPEASDTEAEATGGGAGKSDRKTLVVEQAVRSGQKIYAQGADLVVMGQVSAGAEVIADGNIHVYGVLRGRALAGAAGDTEARILSTCFEAELVAVAGYYLTFEGGFPVENQSKPTSIYLDHGTEPATLRLKAINIR
ncbi:septum site-determining protein MinC [Limnobacter sp.]|uniref:septum site-determining protein MinC n=1 Tax=Limnobacter sp. TaxID=2003368 RepID=UPI0035140564